MLLWPPYGSGSSTPGDWDSPAWPLQVSTSSPPVAQPHTFRLFIGFLGSICFSGCLGNQRSPAVTCCSNTARETKACGHTRHTQKIPPMQRREPRCSLTSPFPLPPAPALAWSLPGRGAPGYAVLIFQPLTVMWLTHSGNTSVV